MFDLSWSPSFFVYSLFHCHLRHCLWFIPSASLPLFFSYTDLFQIWYFPFIVLAYLTICLICLIVLLLILCSHWAPLDPWLMSFYIHVAFYTWRNEFWSLGIWALFSLIGFAPLIFGFDSVVDMDDWDCTFDNGWSDVVWFSDLPYIWYHTRPYFPFGWDL